MLSLNSILGSYHLVFESAGVPRSSCCTSCLDASLPDHLYVADCELVTGKIDVSHHKTQYVDVMPETCCSASAEGPEHDL